MAHAGVWDVGAALGWGTLVLLHVACRPPVSQTSFLASWKKHSRRAKMEASSLLET